MDAGFRVWRCDQCDQLFVRNAKWMSPDSHFDKWMSPDSHFEEHTVTGNGRSPLCRGVAYLLEDPAIESAYLLGGRAAVEALFDGKPLR